MKISSLTFVSGKSPDQKSRPMSIKMKLAKVFGLPRVQKFYRAMGVLTMGTRYPEQLGEIHLVDELKLSEREQGREAGDSVDASLFLQLKYSLTDI
jgi:hypothetical protein